MSKTASIYSAIVAPILDTKQFTRDRVTEEFDGKRIFMRIRNPYHAKTVFKTTKVCECGGSTWSVVSGGDWYLCHHCGKRHTAKEFASLSDRQPSKAETFNRSIFERVLQGCDLRQSKTGNEVELKDSFFQSEGAYPRSLLFRLRDLYPFSVVVEECPPVKRKKQTDEAINMAEATRGTV